MIHSVGEFGLDGQNVRAIQSFWDVLVLDLGHGWEKIVLDQQKGNIGVVTRKTAHD